jgi:uncharacterized phiE125 gp8 family phage protein
MNLVQTVAPADEPLSLEDAKLFMHILENDEDTLITSMISSAREYAENYTNRQFEIATWGLITDCLYSGLTIPLSPVTEILTVEYMDEDAVYQTLSTDDYYSYVEYGATKLHISSAPSYKDDKRAIKITFKAGYTTVPSSIVSFLKVLVSTMYENREQYIVGVSVETMANPAIMKMLDMYKVQSI